MRTDRTLLKRAGAVALLAAVGLLSALWLARVAVSPEFHARSIAALDDQRATVMELTAATAAASVAVAAIPGDATTPIAEEISDLTSYLMLVVGAILLEKVLLTLTGHVTFAYLIPAACALGALSIHPALRNLRRLAVRLTVFGLAICLVIPASLRVGDLVDRTFQTHLTIQQAQDAAEDIQEPARDAAEDGSFSQWLQGLGESITGGVNAALRQAEDALNRFVDAVAVLLIVNCAIPILVLWFFLWLLKAMFNVRMELPRPGRARGRDHQPRQETEER